MINDRKLSLQTAPVAGLVGDRDVEHKRQRVLHKVVQGAVRAIELASIALLLEHDLKSMP